MAIVAKKCNTCRHETICKYVEEMERVQISVYSIDKSTKSPINIDIGCDNYEKKFQKQDGIVYR